MAGDRTSRLAIAALLCGLFVPPIGILLGYMARSKIRETGEKGDGLALIALVVGYIETIILIFAAVVVVATLGSMH
ncbi:MAG: peptidyl-prolyl cis-trans isomerase [Mycobacterium sp.]|nr:peptidyl-prolyl cis-trans isomerase [Mycobacterium sp.]